MIEQLFTYLYELQSGSFAAMVSAAFIWGVLSIILSPCHLSSIPLIVGYISSTGKQSNRKNFSYSLLFSIGILLSIVLIGVITASLGRMLGDVGSIGKYLVSAVFFLVGLYFLDLVPMNWNLFRPGRIANNSLGVLLLGLIFGIGVGPCTFAFMAPVLGVVFQASENGWLLPALLLLSYGIGHCLLIVAAGTLTGTVQRYLDWINKGNTVTWIRKAAGILVIAAGVYNLLQ